MVTGQKVRWVLDLMRGTRVRGPPDRVVRGHAVEHRRSARHRAASKRGRGDDAHRPDRAEGADARRSARTGDTMRVCACRPRRCGTCCSTPARSTGFGWSCFTAVDGDGARRGAGRRDEHDARATSTCASTVDADDGTYTIDDRRRPARRRAAAGSSTAATAATPTTTPRPTDDLVVDRPTRCAVDDARDRAGAGARADRRRLHVARVRDRRRARRARARSDETGARRRSAPRSSCAPANGSCASRTSSTTTRATTGCARTSRCPRRSTGSDAECAFAVVHRGLTAEGGVHEYGLPTFPSRRFVDASDGTAGLALAARRAARVRGRRRRPRARAHAAARGRLPVAHRAVAAAEPGRPARSRSRGAQTARARSAPSTRCCPTAATGARPIATARPTRSSSRSNGRGSRRTRARPTGSRRARCASTAPKSPR